jgi:putative ABC transport system permease protein
VSFWWRKREKELDDELQSHLDMAAHERTERGMADPEALQAARREFGNVGLVGETTRDAWGWRWLEDLTADLRYSVRTMAKSKGFTLVAVLMLALGIGANTAIFSVVNSVLLRPLSYPQADRLYSIHEVVPQWAKFSPSFAVNLNNFQVWQKDCHAFDQVAIAEAMDMDLGGLGDVEQVHGVRASASLFDTLGVHPSLGRGFLPQEDRTAAGRVVVLSDPFWRKRFSGDPEIVGRAISLDGTAYTVVGVLPASFHFPSQLLGASRRSEGLQRDFFVPLDGPRFYELGPIGEFDFVAIARLRVGVTAREALAELNIVQERIAKQAKEDLDLRAELLPLDDEVTGRAKQGLWLLLAAVGAVLLMVCVNLANLLLARVPARMREAAVRSALGATRSRMTRQLMAEFLLLALLGAVLGGALAIEGVKWLVRAAPVELPRLDEVAVDAKAFGFAGFLSLLTCAAFGILPALRIASSGPQETLKSSGPGTTETLRTRRLREALIGFEVAVCTVLLVVAGLLATSLTRLLGAERGFQTDHLLAADVDLPQQPYADVAKRRVFYEQALVGIQQLPGVQSAAWITILPLESAGSVSHISLPNDAIPVDQRPFANYRAVSPGYFETMGIRLLKGRTFTPDDQGHKRIVVSANVADRLWPGQNPVGKECAPAWGTLDQAEVIGVVQNVRAVRLDETPVLMAYVPESYGQPQPGAPGFASIVVRTAVEPSALAGPVRDALRKTDANVPVVAMRPMAEIVDQAVAPHRFQMSLVMVFAVSALLLAALGVFGVAAYSVEQRRRELGLRMALGARANDLRGQVLRQGMRPIAIGFVVGAVGALLAGRIVESFLFGVTRFDPVTLATVTVVVLVVGLLACWIPARRATRVDPIVALRYE